MEKTIALVLLGVKVLWEGKHIDLRRHFVHEAVQGKNLTLKAVSSEDNVADLLTKPLPEQPFKLLRKQLLGL